MEEMSSSILVQQPKNELQLGDKLSGQRGHDHNYPNGCSNVVEIKEENEEDEFEVEELIGFGNNRGVSLSVSKMEEGFELLPKPLEKLLDFGPTPFLTKTYDMVENPEIDDVVSWGENGVSFVVWDPHKLSTDLLPKFFKHSNFSSFVRQLNTYGFRKVHLDRWEFANAGFQRGKQHLLKTIKRKSHGSNNNIRLQKQAEIEMLKQQQEALKVEIHDLNLQQLDSDKCLADMEERMKSAEWKQKKFVLLIAKAMRRTPLFQQLLQTCKQKKALGEEQVVKKRRLASIDSVDNSFLKCLNQNPECCQKDANVRTQLLKKPSLGCSPADLEHGSIQEQKSSLTSDAYSPDLSSGNYIMWEKLMEDDVIWEDDEEDASTADQTKIVHELEDLIVKPATWGNLGKVTGVACPAGQ